MGTAGLGGTHLGAQLFSHIDGWQDVKVHQSYRMTAVTAATAPKPDVLPDAHVTPPTPESKSGSEDQEYLFVNSSSNSTSSELKHYKGHRDVRRFVMQKARKARPWSTSKCGDKMATVGHRGVHKSAPQDNKGRPSSASLSRRSSQTSIDGELVSRERCVVLKNGDTTCEICRSHSPVIDRSLCKSCWQTLSKLLQPQKAVGKQLDPFHTLPVSGDPRSMELELWEQCE